MYQDRQSHNAEGVAYWLVVAPLAARLPAGLAYRVACLRGDWSFWFQAGKRAEIVGNVREVLGSEVGPDAALVGGKGAIICSPHLGSFNSAFSLLHASGFSLTSIGRSLST